VCYLGNLHARRDPGLLFRVLAEIARRLPECRFLVVARPTAEAEHLMREFPAADRLVFTGFVPHAEVPALLRAAHVGIFPLAVDDPYGVYRTSSPLKVMEYLSAGLPVVSSRVPDAEKVLGESGGGVCVDNDAGAFAQAALAYLQDPERARRDGARGRAYIETHRLFDVLALEVEAVYRRLLSTGWPSAPASPQRAERYPATASA
jgi:glycosyltransferase involved in cell wall biosynthesis